MRIDVVWVAMLAIIVSAVAVCLCRVGRGPEGE